MSNSGSQLSLHDSGFVPRRFPREGYHTAIAASTGLFRTTSFESLVVCEADELLGITRAIIAMTAAPGGRYLRLSDRARVLIDFGGGN